MTIENQGKNNLTVFIKGYLNVSEAACLKILDAPDLDKEINMILPIIYNLKHAIELIIKHIHSLIPLNSETARGHDILELLDKLHNKKSNLYRKISKAPYKSEEVKKLYLSNLDELYIRFTPLVKKYYYLEVIKPLIGIDYQIADIENDAFRYPENKLEINLDYDAILLKIKKPLIANIKEDTIELGKIYDGLSIYHSRQTF